MKRLLQNYGFIGAIVMALMISSCKDIDPPSGVSINFSADPTNPKNISFTGVATGEELTFQWNFGDGNSSAEQNPIHTYETSGYFDVSLVATNESGTSGDTIQIGVDLGDFVILTGGAGNTAGKTWKLEGAHSDVDRYVYADADLSDSEYNYYSGTGIELTFGAGSGILSSGAGLNATYNAKFTFFPDGTYEIAANDSAFASLKYATEQGVTTPHELTGTSTAWGICTSPYTAPSNATFTYTPKKDYVVSTHDHASDAKADVTYSGVPTISFSADAYLGLWSSNNEVIIDDITETTMRIIVFYHNATNPFGKVGTYPDANSALVLTLSLVP